MNFYHCPFIFKRHNRLGDTISVLIGLENYAIENNVDSILVAENKLYAEFMDVFDFKHVKFDASIGGAEIDWIFKKSKLESSWLTRFAESFAKSMGGKYSGMVTIPQLKLPPIEQKENIVLFQLDSRSSKPIHNLDMLNILSKHKGQPYAVLGGPDTSHYLGNYANYRIGNLTYIIKQLLSCKYFVGADSGIAHLAGVLGVESYVYPGPYINIDDVRSFFSCYTKTKVNPIPKIKCL